MTLDDLLRLTAEATPGPLTVRRYDHGGGRFSASDAAGYDRNLVADFYHEGDRELFAAFSPEVAAALVKVAMAGKRWVAQVTAGLPGGSEGDYGDLESAVAALDAVLAARP